MKKSIAIIELYQHDEVLRHYCKLLQDSEYSMKIYCSQYVFEALKAYPPLENLEYQVNHKNQTIKEFLQKHEEELLLANLVIFTTVLSDFKMFDKIASKVRSALVIHNVHSFLTPNSYFNLSGWKDVLRRTKTRLYQEHKNRARLLKNTEAIIFPTDTIKDYALSLNTALETKQLIAAPFSSYEKHKNHQYQNAHYTITIPGTVSSAVRNYEEVYEALKTIELDPIKTIKIVLLGKAIESKIVQKFKSLNNKKIQVTYFEKHLSSTDYQKHLQASDLLLLPIKKIAKNHIYSEKMGYSKISGTANDAVQFGIKSLIPSFYPTPYNWTQIFSTYKEGQLRNALQELILNSTAINKEEIEIPDSASFDFQRKQFLAAIDEMLTT